MSMVLRLPRAFSRALVPDLASAAPELERERHCRFDTDTHNEREVMADGSGPALVDEQVAPSVCDNCSHNMGSRCTAASLQLKLASQAAWC